MLSTNSQLRSRKDLYNRLPWLYTTSLRPLRPPRIHGRVSRQARPRYNFRPNQYQPATPENSSSPTRTRHPTSPTEPVATPYRLSTMSYPKTRRSRYAGSLAGILKSPSPDLTPTPTLTNHGFAKSSERERPSNERYTMSLLKGSLPHQFPKTQAPYAMPFRRPTTTRSSRSNRHDTVTTPLQRPP